MQYAQRAPPNAGQPGGTRGPFYKKLYLTAVYIFVYNERQTTIENARENSHARTRG